MMRHKTLFYFYLILSLLSFALAMHQVSFYWDSNLSLLTRLTSGLNQFTLDSYANHASTACMIDLITLYIALAVWMFFESRTLKIKGLIVYLILMWVVCFGAFFPLFMAVREHKLCKLN